MKRVCLNCNKEYISYPCEEGRKFCSSECYKRYKSVTYKCQVCDNKITSPISLSGHRRYCSEECRKSVTHLEKECKECGKIYSIAKSRYNGDFDRFKHCSDECYNISVIRKNQIIIQNLTHACTNCSKVFISRRKNKSGFTFCSQKCSKEFLKGKNHHSFINGTTVNTLGYRCIKVGDKYVLEHRLIMEEHLNRKLNHGEVVHHKDGNKLNNNINNLEVMTKYEHDKHHYIERGGIKSSSKCV